MFKRVVVMMAAGGLALGLTGAGLATGAVVDSVSDRYPGSVRVGDNPIDWHALGQGALRWQATYQTPDGQPLVEQWYAAHLHLSPASELYLTGGDGCAWLQQTSLVWRGQHTVSVLLCQEPAGTRVVVNESVDW